MRGRRAWLVVAATLVAGWATAGCSGHRTFETAIPEQGEPFGLSVFVDDETGLVTAVAPSQASSVTNPIEDVPGTNSVKVSWIGGACDGRTTISLTRAEIAVAIRLKSEPLPNQGCHLVGILRAVVLDLDEFVPASRFGLTIDP